MKKPLARMVFILGILGSFEFHCMCAINYQNFSVCKKPSTHSCNTSENFKCASGKIKISGLSYGENVGCINNDSCKLETCCDGNNMVFVHSVAKDMLVYKNCSFKQECNINLADKTLSQSGFIGYIRSDINYTCVQDSNIVKFCDNCVQTSDQLELIFDGSESQIFNRSPGRCKCIISTNDPNGTFRAFITDIRTRKPSSSSSDCSSVVLNIFDLPFGDCKSQSFQLSGQFVIDPHFSKTVKMDKLFLTGENDIPSLVWITVIAMNSSFVTVNCSAIETDPDYSSFATDKSSKPIELQTLPTIITTRDGQTTILLKPTIIKEWGTSTDEGPKAANTSRDTGNDSNTISMLLHVVLPIAGGLILTVLVSVTILCTRGCRNKKQMLRTKVSGSNSLGNSDPPFEVDSLGNSDPTFEVDRLGNSNPPFEVDNADGVHNYEEMREHQNSELNLFSDIDTSKAMAQGYDYITFEKIPPKKVLNYDLMMENVDIPLSDSTYSHVTSETFSSKCFKPAEYSQISFDKTGTAGTGEKLNVGVDRNGQSTAFDRYSHIELESKPSVSIINPIGKSEQTISDNNSHTTLRSGNDNHHSSSRPGGTVVDGDSYSHLAFNAKKSRDDNDLDMTIRFGNIQNYNYAKVNREHKKQKPRDNMEIMQIGEVDGLDRTDGMEKGSENDDNAKVNLEHNKRKQRDNMEVIKISEV